MQQADQVRIRHMYDAVRTALMLARNRTRNDLEQNITLQLALVKLIEIVGEAAVRVSPELKDQAPDIPWPEIIGMRHRLIHAYYDINRDTLWNTITEDLPPLLLKLTKLLEDTGS